MKYLAEARLRATKPRSSQTIEGKRRDLTSEGLPRSRPRDAAPTHMLSSRAETTRRSEIVLRVFAIQGVQIASSLKNNSGGCASPR